MHSISLAISVGRSLDLKTMGRSFDSNKCIRNLFLYRLIFNFLFIDTFFVSDNTLYIQFYHVYVRLILYQIIIFKKKLACGARGPGFDFRPRHLDFQRFVISCFQFAIWLKYRWSDVNPQYNKPTTNQQVYYLLYIWKRWKWPAAFVSITRGIYIYIFEFRIQISKQRWQICREGKFYGAFNMLVYYNIISPLPVKPSPTGETGGTLGFLAVRHSVCLSVRLSVHSVSVHSVFRTFLSRPLRYWLEIWYVNLSWHNTDQIWVSSRLTYIYRSYCPLLKFSFPGFSLPSFEILNEIWYMNLSWHNTDQVRVSLRSTNFYRSYCPLLKFSFPDFSLLSFEILTWNLVYEFALT